MKDLFDDNGNFITEEILQEKLNNKYNWISEFFMVKNVVYKNIRKQDSCIRNISLYTASSRIDPKQLAAKEWYKILVDKKKQKKKPRIHKICGKKNWICVFVKVNRKKIYILITSKHLDIKNSQSLNTKFYITY